MTEQEFLLHKITENDKKIEECHSSIKRAEKEFEEIDRKIERLNDSLVESSSDFLFIPKDNPQVHELNGLLKEKGSLEEDFVMMKKELDELTEENAIFENLLQMLKKKKKLPESTKEKQEKEKNEVIIKKEEESINNKNICSNNQIPVDIESLRTLKSVLSLSKKISLSDSRRCNVEIGKALSMIDKILKN